MSETSHWLEIDRLRHHWIEAGEAGNEEVVCLHGLTRNARDFLPVLRLLGRRYHVRAVDFRGRGESGWGSPERYRIEQYVDDLAALLRAWGTRRVSLIGTSLGGLVSMLFASRHPEAIERLVLNDIGPEIDPRGAGRILETTLTAPETFRDRGQVVSYFRHYFPTVAAMPGDEVWELAQSSLRRRADGTIAWKLDPAVRRALGGDGAKQVTPNLWDAFRHAGGELVVLRGTLSDVLSETTLRRMERARPDGKYIEVPGVGHTPLLSEPEATRALRDLFMQAEEAADETDGRVRAGHR